MSSDTFKLFLTPEHDCSYIKGNSAQSVFLDPSVVITTSLYVKLNQQGFRRSGRFLYKPRCQNCNACISTRVVVDEFNTSRSQRRIIKRNLHLSVRRIDTIDTDAIYGLYEKYIRERHADGDMYPATREQFRSFLVEKMNSSFYIGFFDKEQLIGVSAIDYVDDGLSALYTFYEPSLPRQALGVFAILWQINECKRLKLPYLYLGYWIKSCDKMNYKTRYQPQQHLVGNTWRTMLINNDKPPQINDDIALEKN